MFKQSSTGRSFLVVSSISAATVLLAACGGGGKIPKPEPAPQPPVVAPSPAPTPTPTPTPDPAPENWTACAAEGEVCTFPGTKTVRFGANGKYATATATGSIRCSVNDFADPLPGVQKSCSYSSTGESGGAAPAPTPTPTPTPPETSTPAPSAAVPYGQNAANYTLTFSEEFDKGFNKELWNDTIWYEASNATKNYTVEDGVLKIWPQRDASGKFFNRTIDTDGKYYQTYGYFEIEAKLPVGKGTWPAFWLFNHIGNRRPEIDVMEAYAGGGPNSGWSDARLHPTAFAATVWRDETVQAGTKTLQTPDLSAGFHKYAVKWEPNKQTFYFDGKEFFSVNVSMGDPMYLMLDLWFGSASGQPDDSTPQGKSNSYEVNYVRAWQFK